MPLHARTIVFFGLVDFLVLSFLLVFSPFNQNFLFKTLRVV
jgi:hypothetical protein